MDKSTSPKVLIVEDLKEQRLQARSVAAALSSSGVAVSIVDTEKDLGALLAQLKCQPSLIIFSVLFSDRLGQYLDAMNSLRTAGVRAHFTMVGPLPALASAALLSTCSALDSVVCGEPEQVAIDLATRISDAAAWAQIPGLVCRAKGQPPLSSRRPASLDRLAVPWREDGLADFHGRQFATVESSRGCYHRCSFCLPAAYYGNLHAPYRRRAIVRVADELENLYARGVRLVLFDDEQFLPPPSARTEFVSRLVEQIESRGLRLAFTIKCRADDVDATLFDTLKRVGLVRVFVGLESGCQDTLDLYGKGTRVEQNIAALIVLKDLGIVADFRSLLLHPWSTLETLEAEINFLKSVLSFLVTGLDFRVLEVYPGTPIAKRFGNDGSLGTRSWHIEYSIYDDRAELARRLAHLLFISSREYRRWLDSLSQAWYDHLVDHRLNPTPDDASQAKRLEEQAQEMNADMLQVWREVLTFLCSGPIQDATEVNRCAAEWGLRIQARAREKSALISQIGPSRTLQTT